MLKKYFQRRICSEKEKDIYIVQNKERGSVGVLERLVEEKLYLTIKITIDITSVLCAEKGWKEEDSARLQIHKHLDDKEQLSVTTDFRSDRQYWEEEGVYKNRFKMGV